MPFTKAQAPRAPRQQVRPNLILGICCMSLLLVGMDVTIVNVALPAIERDLHASLAGLQWIMDAYTLVVASLLMLSGSVSDRVGRRRIFQIGLTLFIFGSLLCSLSHTIGQLIAFRAVQGLGASMLNPVALSIVANVFKDPAARARAVGVWGAVGGASFAIGPLLGGILTQTIGWRSIFWVNIPLGLLAVILAALFVPESKAQQARAFDPIGQLLVFTTLTTLTFAVIDGTHDGWHSPIILGLFVTAAASLLAFLFYEPRRYQPLVDLRFFRSIPFTSSTLLGLCAFASFAAFLFLNALYLQQVRGFSAFHTGLSTLPLAAGMMICSPVSGRMVAAHGTRPSLFLSGAGFFVGTLLLTRLTSGTPFWLLLVAYALFGIGLGMVNPAITNNAVAGMPLAQAGVAAAIASTSRQVGAALGIAVSGTIVNAARAHHIGFAQATHPIWWIMVACGAVIIFLGWLSNTPWSHATVQSVASLLETRA